MSSWGKMIDMKVEGWNQLPLPHGPRNQPSLRCPHGSTVHATSKGDMLYTLSPGAQTKTKTTRTKAPLEKVALQFLAVILLFVTALGFYAGACVRTILSSKMAMHSGKPVIPATIPNEMLAFDSEAFVHPAMITHPNPKRVAFVGGRGAVVREILKHRAVEEVTVLGIDQNLEELDRTDLKGSSDSCVDDRWVSMVFEDAFQLLRRRGEDRLFDVVLMGTNHRGHYNSLVELVELIFDRLSEHGVLVAHIPPDDKADQMVEALQDVGFDSLHMYDEGPSHFVVALKDYKTRARWYMTPAELDIQLHQRLHRTLSGKPSLRFFDAPAMVRFQVPHKSHETSYCQQEDTPWECDEYIGLDPELSYTRQLEAKKSTLGENAGRGLFATQDIPQWTLFDIGSGFKAFHFLPVTWSVIEDLYNWADDGDAAFIEDSLSSVVTFVEGYGYRATLLGEKHFCIDSGILLFCNHGCSGTCNFGDDESSEFRFTEWNVDLDQAPEELLNRATQFSPVYERHLRQILALGDYTLRDISAGEEIFCDYLSFVGDPDDWKDEVMSLRGQCTGELGDISAYEVKDEAPPDPAPAPPKNATQIH